MHAGGFGVQKSSQAAVRVCESIEPKRCSHTLSRVSGACDAALTRFGKHASLQTQYIGTQLSEQCCTSCAYENVHQIPPRDTCLLHKPH